MNACRLKQSTGELFFPLNGGWVSTNKKEESANTQDAQDNQEPSNSDDSES